MRLSGIKCLQEPRANPCNLRACGSARCWITVHVASARDSGMTCSAAPPTSCASVVASIMDTSTLLEAAAQHFQDARPFLPMYLHLILAALFPIYAGAHASLSRPSSAARPVKTEKRSANDEGQDEEDEEDEEEDVQQMEGLSPQDAIVFPVTAGIVLAALYFLIKRYGADIVNVVLGVYFTVVGTFSVGKLVNDAMHTIATFVFPDYFAKNGRLWKVDAQQSKAVAQDDSGATSTAMVGVSLPDAWLNSLWQWRALLNQKFSTKLYMHDVVDFRAKLTRVNAASAIIGVCSVAYATVIDKPWWLTNLQGFGVCYGAMQLMSPTSFTTGSLILLGLFCYDVWAVFFTPLMVTVAKNLDVPIKLLFPRPDEGYSMLGLGDIVLPGIMMGLALRFDLYMFYLRKQEKRQVSKSTAAENETSDEVDKAPYVPVTSTFGDRFWTRSLPTTAKPETLSFTFPKPYFIASVVGYVIGMLATLGVMSVFQHAQPALLYLVPGVLLSLWGTGLTRGELKHMWEFSEAINGEPLDEEEGKKADQERDEKDDRSWVQYLKDEIFGTDPKKAAEGKAKHSEAKEPQAAKPSTHVLVSFSISRFPSGSQATTSKSEGIQTASEEKT
ncbi:hypothetical protein EJ03DRAFT_323647 [Teratosphaeria nubilosa]|uniref:Peptidase A22B, signal peptide peptidase n=1 Tax=Teratosphaeria nubilosa TaxID=161662 RepID=A0A6G1LMA7_9PEZI|nr:hypothetical protein EJ03DRAFT_323647 [Teratosphaeria nubilosa]